MRVTPARVTLVVVGEPTQVAASRCCDQTKGCCRKPVVIHSPGSSIAVSNALLTMNIPPSDNSEVPGGADCRGSGRAASHGLPQSQRQPQGQTSFRPADPPPPAASGEDGGAAGRHVHWLQEEDQRAVAPPPAADGAASKKLRHTKLFSSLWQHRLPEERVI